MWHPMWLTLSFVCYYLSAMIRVDAAPVDNVEEAAGYLERFGYLERWNQDSSYSENISAESFSDAIRDFQSFAGLKKTGELDKETLELMNKPRCGVPDRVRPSSSNTRQKRFAIQGSKWPKKQLTYKIEKYTPDMSQSEVDREIARAFQMWADVTDLTFVHVNNQSADVDINILFATGGHDGEHGNCSTPFIDGQGHTLAHATYPIYGGDAHSDDGEAWTLNSCNIGTNLFQVATHEFGHSLGLGHTHVKTAVMYPFQQDYIYDFKLDKDDIEGIQELYGKNQFSRKLALELKDTIELLRATVNNLEKKNIELRDDLIDTRTNLNKKLEETKQNLVETRVDLVKIVDDLSEKLNATEKKLAETKMTTGKLSTELKNCVANSNRLGQESKVAEENLKKDLRATSTDLETTKNEMASMRTELNSTKSAVADLATELKGAVSQRFDDELKTAENNLNNELGATSNDLETATTTLASTRTELSNTMSAVADLTTKLNARTREIVDIGRMPTSCADLERMGHKLSGFFLVKGSKKMETLYCDFYPNQNDKQKWIGYADVKSAPVHFYVTRNSSFNARYTPVPFDLAWVNEGNAMNLTSGIFTAPRPGIYFFSLAGVARLSSLGRLLFVDEDESPSHAEFSALLFLNGIHLASSFVQEKIFVFVDQRSPLSIQSTLNLKKGDQVWVQIWYSDGSSLYLFDDSNHHTHFTGFMCEEKIVASL